MSKKKEKKTNPLVDGKDLKPEMTVHVDNSELLKQMEAYKENSTSERMDTLLNCMVKTRVLIPATLDEQKRPEPCLVTKEEGQFYMAVYTDIDQIPENLEKDGIMNMAYIQANAAVVAQKDRLKGLVVNPFTHNLIMEMPLLERIQIVERNKAQFGNMTDQQYVQYERRRFEAAFLPQKLFSEGQQFVEKLIEEKEDFIDKLYEESYQKKRLYPYIEEDFSVMTMDISSELMIVRVDMPERDIIPGLVHRLYVIWNPKQEKAGYYRITEGGQGQRILEEINAEIQIKDHGTAPEEGVEVQRIIELASEAGAESE